VRSTCRRCSSSPKHGEVRGKGKQVANVSLTYGNRRPICWHGLERDRLELAAMNELIMSDEEVESYAHSYLQLPEELQKGVTFEHYLMLIRRWTWSYDRVVTLPATTSVQ